MIITRTAAENEAINYGLLMDFDQWRKLAYSAPELHHHCRLAALLIRSFHCFLREIDEEQ